MGNWNRNAKDTFNKAFKAENLGGTISGVLGGVAGMAEAGMKNAEIADTSGMQSSIDDTANTDFTSGDYDSLLSTYNPMALQSSNYTGKDVRGATGGEMFMNTMSGVMSGVSAGATLGGGWGAIAGGLAGLGVAGGLLTTVVSAVSKSR